MNIKRKQLVEVAEELNEFLGLEPEIDVDLPTEELKKEVIEAIDFLEEGEEEELTEETQEVIELLVKEEEEEEEEEEEYEDEDEIEEEEEVKPKEEKKNKPPKQKGNVTRLQAAGMALKDGNGKTIHQLIKETDEIYVNNGGTSHERESRVAVTQALNVLKGFGIEIDVKR